MSIHFKVNREDLIKAISDLQGITNKKGNMSILGNVLIETSENRLILTGTDLEIGLKQYIPAEILQEGKITLPAKKLFELARESGTPEILFKEIENAWVEIISGSSQYKLAGMIAEEFPQFPLYNESLLISIDSEIMSEMIDKTIFSIALDKEGMFALTSTLVQFYEDNDKYYIKLVSSDGHRLTTMSKEIDEKIFQLKRKEPILIPRRGIQEIRKFCENKESIFLHIEEKQIVLKSNFSILIVRLMNGDFPDFNNVINSISQDISISINRIRFLESLKRINLFTEDLFHAIKIKISNKNILLESQHADFGSAKDSFSIKYQGEDIDLAFNCRFFIDILQAMEGDIIDFCVKDERNPCMITSSQDEGFLSIVMPMKI